MLHSSCSKFSAPPPFGICLGAPHGIASVGCCPPNFLPISSQPLPNVLPLLKYFVLPDSENYERWEDTGNFDTCIVCLDPADGDTPQCVEPSQSLDWLLTWLHESTKVECALGDSYRRRIFRRSIVLPDFDYDRKRAC